MTSRRRKAIRIRVEIEAPAKPEWRQVPEFAGYKIDQHGRVRSDDRSRFGRATSSGKGSFFLPDDLVSLHLVDDVVYCYFREAGAQYCRSVNKLYRQVWGKEIPKLWKPLSSSLQERLSA